MLFLIGSAKRFAQVKLGRNNMATRSGEFDLIARHFAPIAQKSKAALSLLDDAALLSPPEGHEIVITVDALVSNVHFRSQDDPGDIARKVMRVNLSDLAAMGAHPLGVLLTSGYNRDLSEDWIATFADGLGQDCEAFDAPLLGGDTVGTPGPTFFSLTAIGAVPAGRAMRRDAAKPGDVIAVTGTLGDGALGLKVLQDSLGGLTEEDSAYLSSRYWLPQPRLKTGIKCAAGTGRYAAMDISDGLAGDCRKICSASGVGMIFDQERIPLSQAAMNAVQGDPALWASVLGGGDDYELLICADHADIKALGDDVTIIGEVTDQVEQVDLIGADKKIAELAKGGFDHF